MRCFPLRFLLLFLFFLNISEMISILQFTYPSAITLSNGNILIIEKDGIYICDQTMENIIKTVLSFSLEDQMRNEDSLSKVVMKDKNGYIICLVNFKLFFFNREGTLLKMTDKLLSEYNPTYYSLTPIFVKNNYYYYTIAYFDGNLWLNFLYFKISLLDYSNTFINIYTFNTYKGFQSVYSYTYLNRGLSCEYMEAIDTYLFGTHYYYIVCYLMVDDDGDSITQDFYEVDESSIENQDGYRCSFIKIQNVKQIKTLTINNIKKALVIVFIEDNNMYKINIYTYYFEYMATHLDYLNGNYICSKNFFGNKINYIYEKDLLSFSCISTGASIQSILINNNLNIIQTKTQFERCETIYGHSVIFSNYYNEYYVVSDVICYRIKWPFFSLNGEIPLIGETILEEEEKSDFIEEEKKIEQIKEEEKISLIEKEEEIYIEQLIEKEKFDEELEKIEEKYEIIEEKIIEKEIFEEKEEESISNKDNKKTTVVTTELQIGCIELEKCSQCNPESIYNNLCINCNNEKGFYLLKVNYNSNKYVDCVNDTTKPYNFYFDQENQAYEQCYETCFKCNNKGNWLNNNCTVCDGITYIKKPEYENSTNCVPKCKYLYYYDNYDQYKCSDNPYCPDDYNYLIKNKNKCTNNCTKDDTYKYYYNRECYKQCPENTEDNEDYICKDSIINRCILSESEFFLFNENITDDMVEKMAMIYAAEFGYTDTHVSIYKNDIYSVTIYKDLDCISDLSLNTPEIIFGECEIKVKENYNIKENLIVAIIDKIIEGTNQRRMISYGLFSPTSGNNLHSNTICEDDKLVIFESLSYKLENSNIDISTLSQLYSQGINIFNLSGPFYTDVCFQYNSVETKDIKDKDIALKDRILVFFPNITLCEEECDMKGINLTTLKAICECTYVSNNKNILKDNALYQSQAGELEELISNTNIYVIKCYKNIISKKYFKECIGGLVIFFILIIEIICIINYYLKGFFSIKVYIFDISNRYINYISPKKNHKRSIKNISQLIIKNEAFNKNNRLQREKNFMKIRQEILKKNPNYNNVIIHPKRKEKKLILRRHLLYRNKDSQVQINEKHNINMNSNLFSENFMISKEINTDMVDSSEKNIKDIIIKNDIKPNMLEKPEIISNEIFNNKNININNNDNNRINNLTEINLNTKYDEFFEEYLQVEFDEMDFDDLLENDKRKYCEYYKEKLFENQIILNTFCYKEPFKPMSIKILLLLLQIDLYLLINGLFYDEKYVSKVFHLKKDTFSDQLGRFFDNLVYAALVGIIINYIIEWLFIEESRLKKVFKKKKDELIILKDEINNIISDIKRRYIFFIIITFLITIFTWIHISCFNIVYPHLKWEWLIFSAIIIAIMQIFSAIICFLQTILRFISFKCKSEKMYKISYLLS